MKITAKKAAVILIILDLVSVAALMGCIIMWYKASQENDDAMVSKFTAGTVIAGFATLVFTAFFLSAVGQACNIGDEYQ